MRGRLCALAACVAFVLGSTVFLAPTAGAITKEACNQPIVVARLAFGPGTIPRGQSSTARLSGRNCTRHRRTVTITWTATFSGNQAAGCPVIDPLRQNVTVPAASALTASLRYLVPAGCTATRLTATARVTNAAGNLIRSKTADLRIIQPHSG
jgi:hypothetical protein